MSGFRFRHFLNNDEWGGIALVDVAVATSREDWSKQITVEHAPYMDGGSFTVGDCSRQVTLDFSLDSVKARENSRAKLELLLYTLLEFTEAWEREAQYAERVATARKNRGLAVE